MPRLYIIAVGDKLSGWANEACDEYLKRLPRGFEALLFEVRAEPRTSGKSVEQMMVAEAQKLRASLSRGARLVGLDERGKDLTTKQFASLLGAPTAFVIGGADGLDPALKKEAALLLRLSALTLPHALAQVVLCEQLYRAATLLTGHPYHRE